MTKLPAELQDMVEHSGDTPVRVVDPRTQRVYVLILDEQFDRLRRRIRNGRATLAESGKLLAAFERRNRRHWGRATGAAVWKGSDPGDDPQELDQRFKGPGCTFVLGHELAHIKNNDGQEHGSLRLPCQPPSVARTAPRREPS